MISIPLSEKPDNTSFVSKWRAFLIICFKTFESLFAAMARFPPGLVVVEKAGWLAHLAKITGM